jgi:hypothetical protein
MIDAATDNTNAEPLATRKYRLSSEFSEMEHLFRFAINTSAVIPCRLPKTFHKMIINNFLELSEVSECFLHVRLLMI